MPSVERQKPSAAVNARISWDVNQADRTDNVAKPWQSHYPDSPGCSPTAEVIRNW